MVQVDVEVVHSHVLRTILLHVGQDRLAELTSPLGQLLPHTLAPLLDLLAVERQQLLALDPQCAQSVVDEVRSDIQLGRDVSWLHALQVSEEHPALLLILLHVPALELAPGEAHSVL